MKSVDKRGFTHAEAIAYLGIKRRAFDAQIRPLLKRQPVRCGTALIFDRFDLDEAWEQYCAQRNGRPG